MGDQGQFSRQASVHVDVDPRASRDGSI
jgi:hypothetical protein